METEVLAEQAHVAKGLGVVPVVARSVLAHEPGHAGPLPKEEPREQCSWEGNPPPDHPLTVTDAAEFIVELVTPLENRLGPLRPYIWGEAPAGHDRRRV